MDAKWHFNKDYTADAILFGRAKTDGNAETVSQNGLSASKLWLGKLPGSGEAQ